MKAEIIAVGTELLIGDVINSNASWISKQLASLGVDVYYHSTVGDNPARLQGVVQQAASRSELLIFTGGLGPTEDDLTIATLAELYKTPLIVDPESLSRIRDYFIVRGMAMSPTNRKQANKPQGALTIQNPIGTAPGIAWDIADFVGKPTWILTFPGVPKELFAMWPQAREQINAYQQVLHESPSILASRNLHFFGIGESKLAESLSDLMKAENPTVAPYVGQAQVRIRITAKANTQQEAEALIEPVQAEILRRCGDACFGQNSGDASDVTLESAVAQYLTQEGNILTVAESCTGGLISSRLTDISGSSAYTLMNWVTYGNFEKMHYLGVQAETLKTYGAVSSEVAIEMARGVQKKQVQALAESRVVQDDYSKSLQEALASPALVWGLSITGIAGPTGGIEAKPIGLAYIGIISPQGDTWIKKVLVNPKYSRPDIKHWFSQYALAFLLQAFRGTLITD